MDKGDESVIDTSEISGVDSFTQTYRTKFSRSKLTYNKNNN
jgi:hypothetical protein